MIAKTVCLPSSCEPLRDRRPVGVRQPRDERPGDLFGGGRHLLGVHPGGYAHLLRHRHHDLRRRIARARRAQGAVDLPGPRLVRRKGVRLTTAPPAPVSPIRESVISRAGGTYAMSTEPNRRAPLRSSTSTSGWMNPFRRGEP
ncbi:hypothetical protein [Streptomyces yanii]|uniref:Uncharacterized protein n=1 Tax=Streptomyces yanii TaxID=78510 RepID=A0ABV5RDD8_9ACTN